jgi:hypothetical protein
VQARNQPQTEAELEATGRCVARGQPCGGEQWVAERRNNWDWNQRCEHHTGRERGSRTNDSPNKQVCPPFSLSPC